jgi:predicted GTPase
VAASTIGLGLATFTPDRIKTDLRIWVAVHSRPSIELETINVLTGSNGADKSNLCNSLVLIGRAVQGQLARAIAEEGGTPSVPVAAPSTRPGSHRTGYELAKWRPRMFPILDGEAKDAPPG